MKRKKITIKDIAKELDVSVSTVSKSLKDSHEISKETKDRIKAFAAFHNYKPNTLALKLRHQRTHIIGIIVPEIVHHFFATVIRGVEEYANERGYNVMICLSDTSYEKEIKSIETLLEGNVDGILISVSTGTQEKNNYEHIDKLISEKVPVVLFDGLVEELACDKVLINDEGASFNATEYLIKTGCKRIALITNPDFVRIGALRTRGYLKALKKYNFDIDESLIIKIDESKDMESQVDVLFSDKDNYPDAVLAINGEIYASYAMRLATEKGLRVPDDFSVITFTDGVISKYTSPPLTSLVQHGFEMGKQAVELLVNRIEAKNTVIPIQEKVISTKLKIRKSTRVLN
ncbi:MAG: LacI family DNA-binding transcriptional regulator [Flavobacteriaceae bacterium]|nr:LacI family DNA-binding transcriptional regulator [Flavobacteriaceae bacterium]